MSAAAFATSPYAAGIEAANMAEAEAKLCYEIWAHRAGWDQAWEHLPERERQGLREVVEYLRSEPSEIEGAECSCGAPLLCVNCDRQEVDERIAEIQEEWVCKGCGCTGDKPCVDGKGRVCAWAESHLCDFCAEKRKPLVAVYSELEMEAVLAAVAHA